MDKFDNDALYQQFLQEYGTLLKTNKTNVVKMLDDYKEAIRKEQYEKAKAITVHLSKKGVNTADTHESIKELW